MKSSEERLDEINSELKLTARERMIVEALISGYRRKDSAELLEITDNTVKAMITNAARRNNKNGRKLLSDYRDLNYDIYMEFPEYLTYRQKQILRTVFSEKYKENYKSIAKGLNISEKGLKSSIEKIGLKVQSNELMDKRPNLNDLELSFVKLIPKEKRT